jgi:hypothetical protein
MADVDIVVNNGVGRIRYLEEVPGEIDKANQVCSSSKLNITSSGTLNADEGRILFSCVKGFKAGVAWMDNHSHHVPHIITSSAVLRQNQKLADAAHGARGLHGQEFKEYMSKHL